MTLSSVAVEVIDAKDALIELMACRSAALYIMWLLGQRQRRCDRLLAARLRLWQRRARVAHDLYYIEYWSLWLDLIILLKTAGIVAAGQEAY
jgi:hypothetical protein